MRTAPIERLEEQAAMGVQPFQVVREWEARREDPRRLSTWKYDDLWRAACSARSIMDYQLQTGGEALRHHVRQMNDSYNHYREDKKQEEGS